MKVLLMTGEGSFTSTLTELINGRFPQAEISISDDLTTAENAGNGFHFQVIDFAKANNDSRKITRLVRKRQPGVHMIIYGTQISGELILKHRRYGGNHIIHLDGINKHIVFDVFNLIETVKRGSTFDTYIKKQERVRTIPIAQPDSNPFHVLSEREFQVAYQILAGKKIGEIASELNISNTTASTYKRRVFDKLLIPSYNVIELLKLAQRYEVI